MKIQTNFMGDLQGEIEQKTYNIRFLNLKSPNNLASSGSKMLLGNCHAHSAPIHVRNHYDLGGCTCS